MLSGVFRFILPDISIHFILHDLLRSFRIARPLGSSWVPPWDLLRVLSFLRGPVLVALTSARRAGELQALSGAVSFHGDDIYLSYLPESASNPLLRSFQVHSLCDFVGSLISFFCVPCGLCGCISLILLLSLLVLVHICFSTFSVSSVVQKCPEFLHP